MPLRLGESTPLPTIDDLEERFGLKGKRVLVRIDINSPIDPHTGRILDDSRIRAHIGTLRELAEKGAAVVAISHQGRPGEDDFVSLDGHAKLLEERMGRPVKFIDDVIGPAAREAIASLEPGEILLLDNVRIVSEEVIEAVPERHMNTLLVRRLAPLFDSYINDAFATAHRSQPSVVGFPLRLPAALGRVFERELRALAKLYDPEVEPKVFVLGGGKVHDTVRIIEHLVQRRMADRILTTGLVAELFLVAKGVNIGDKNRAFLERKGLVSLVPRARRILLKGAPIETPVDFLTLDDGDGEVRVEPVGSIKGLIRDIGPETMKMYSELIYESKLVVLRGPAGVIEDPRFREGTRTIIRAALESKAYVIIGGGHLGAIASELDVKRDEGLHISTGGGALLLFLAGEELPAISALRISAKKFYGWE